MAENEGRKRDAAEVEAERLRKAALEAEAERKLAQRLVVGLPLATVLAAAGVGIATNFATAVLVLVGGALVAVIAWLWASIRTLAGDAPLPEHLEEAAVARLPLDEKRTRKTMLLRALKDLENERAIGKLDAEDFETVAQRYRREVKQLMREMDEALAPYRARAEATAKEFLDARSAGPSAEKSEEKKASEPPPASTKNACPKCGTANDVDAKFCKSCAHAFGGEQP